jgi:hypothetical protein
MRTITLLAVSILLTTGFANAQETRSFNVNVSTTRFSNNEPISFMEKGIEFFVFQNGDFDFNTRPNDTQGSFFFKSAGRRVTAKGSRPTNYGVLIEQDSFGRIRRVGNTFINYDINDRVTRIGTVFMKYDRFALTQVGNMRLIYNRFGDLVDTVGSIKGRTNNGFTSTYYGTAQNYYSHNNYNDYSYNDDNNYYYYKADGTKAKVEDKK